MGLTITEVPGTQDVQGKTRVRYFDITGDASYLTQGEAIDFRPYGFRRVFQVDAGLALTATATTAIQYAYRPTTGPDGPVGTMVGYWGNAGSASVLPEVTSTTDVSTFTSRIKVEGE